MPRDSNDAMTCSPSVTAEDEAQVPNCLMRAFVRCLLARGLLPDHLAVLAIERHHDIAMHAAASSCRAARAGVGTPGAPR